MYTCDPSLEISGQLVQSFFCNSEFDRIEPFLKKHGLYEVDPQKWYSLHQMLKIIDDISHNQGSMFNLVSLGMAATDVTVISSEVKQLPFGQFLTLVGQIYPSNYRNGDPGWMKAEEVEENHYKIVINTPYPDDLFYGQFYRLANIFLSHDMDVTVYYDPDIPRRDQGGEVTVIHIAWNK